MSYQSFAEGAKDVAGLLHGMVVNTFREAKLIEAAQWGSVPERRAGYEFQRIDALPTAGPRALHTDYTRSTHRSTPGYEALRIYGARIGFDRAGRRMGIQNPATMIQAAAKSVALTIEAHLVNGDPDSNILQLGGLKYWAANSGDSDTVISAGATAGGAALSIKTLRDAMDICDNPNLIVCGTEMANLMAGAAENSTVRGNFSETKDDFGRKIMQFDGIPIIGVDRDGTDAQAKILPFTEAAASGGNTATSLFVIGNHPGTGWTPFQMGMPEVVAAETNSSSKDRDVEHLVGSVAVHPRSVVRIQHIGNADVTS